MEGSDHAWRPDTDDGVVEPEGTDLRVQRQHDRFKGEDQSSQGNGRHHASTRPSLAGEHVATDRGEDQGRDDVEAAHREQVGDVPHDVSSTEQLTERVEGPVLRECRGSLPVDRISGALEGSQQWEKHRAHEDDKDHE